LDDLAERFPVCFAVHPRTRQRIADFGLSPRHDGVRLLEPLGYLETIGLVDRSALVLTDSGGLQEGTPVLGVPCLPARPNTERPITVTEGTNRLVAATRDAIGTAVETVLAAKGNGTYRANRPERWDGRAGERVIQSLLGEILEG